MNRPHKSPILIGCSLRDADRITFDRLITKMPDRTTCRLMVAVLSLAPDRNCEAEFAADLAAVRLPNMTVLGEQFAPDPATLPDVVVHLSPLNDYEALLGKPVELKA